MLSSYTASILPSAKQELEVEHKTVDKQLVEPVHQQDGDYHDGQFEHDSNACLSMVQKQVQLRGMAPLPEVIPQAVEKFVQQQVQTRYMAALPETDSEEDNDVLVHHQVAVDTSRTRQETQTKASKAKEEQVQLRDMAALPVKNPQATQEAVVTTRSKFFLQ